MYDSEFETSGNWKSVFSNFSIDLSFQCKSYPSKKYASNIKPGKPAKYSGPNEIGISGQYQASK